MEPETTKNYEIGTKWDLMNDRLSLTADIFRTEKENARVQTDTTSYENAGKTRVQGIELSASGKITDKWQVFAGYAYMDSEQTVASAGQGQRWQRTAEHAEKQRQPLDDLSGHAEADHRRRRVLRR
jgi:outer membrane receptor for monomeric catechols